MRHLPDFVRAVAQQTGTIVTGVLFTIAGLVWQLGSWINPELQAPAFRPWMMWLGGLATCFYAASLAWRDERARADRAELALRDSRPRFALTGCALQTVPVVPVGGTVVDAIGSEILLRLDFENRGHHSAVAFSGRLLFLFQDANVPPMPVDFDHTGDIAPGVSMMWRSQPLTMAPPERALRPLVVGFLIRYADAVTGGRFCQVWWNRWRGLDERGNFQTVFNTVTSGEIETLKEKIERFEMACPPEGHI